VTEKDDRAPKLQGWKARNCEASVQDDIVTVKAKGDAPFLGVGARVNGSAVLKLRVRCAKGSDGKIELVTPAKTFPFSLQPRNSPWRWTGSNSKPAREHRDAGSFRRHMTLSLERLCNG